MSVVQAKDVSLCLQRASGTRIPTAFMEGAAYVWLLLFTCMLMTVHLSGAFCTLVSPVLTNRSER